jgi:ubiquinone/menaquinone biosynthesis C-methylase UbiE
MDLKGLGKRMQQTWAAGDFNRIALGVVQASETLVASANVRPGERVLDVACGNGNASLVAARRCADVAGLDYVPALIESARARAAVEGSIVDFRVADAQALPFDDAAFDVVLSAFGVMFAVNQEQAASELLRVCRPGGRIALASWMPEGFGGDVFRVLADHVPSPDGTKPPVRWGTIEGLHALLGPGAIIEANRETLTQYYRSLDHMVDMFFEYFGPAVRAREAVGDAGFPGLRRDLLAVFSTYNRATDGAAEVECEYLLALARRS